MTDISSTDSLRAAAAALAAGRITLGVVALVAPQWPARPWVGRGRSDQPAVRVLGRALGGRDIGLGLGALGALARPDAPAGQQLVPWLLAGGLADAADVVATIAAWRHLPRTKWTVLAAAIGASAGSAVICAGLVSPPSR